MQPDQPFDPLTSDSTQQPPHAATENSPSAKTETQQPATPDAAAPAKKSHQKPSEWAKEHDTPAWAYAAARTGNKWDREPNLEVDEKTYVDAIEAAQGVSMIHGGHPEPQEKKGPGDAQ